MNTAAITAISATTEIGPPQPTHEFCLVYGPKEQAWGLDACWSDVVRDNTNAWAFSTMFTDAGISRTTPCLIHDKTVTSLPVIVCWRLCGEPKKLGHHIGYFGADNDHERTGDFLRYTLQVMIKWC